VEKLKRPVSLVWQSLSFPIAYVSANIYLNINNYVDQIDRFFGTGFNTYINENGIVAVAVFLILFLFPNLYVFTSLHLLKNDLLDNKLQPDVSIIPHDDYIEIGSKEYRLVQELNSVPFSFIIISLFPLLINYSSLVQVLASVIIIILTGSSCPGTSFIAVNPYLRSKYDVYVLKNDDKTIYIVMEKEKELEKPKFSNYMTDWFYGHMVIIGFRKEE
jgi:hypothetical protein